MILSATLAVLYLWQAQATVSTREHAIYRSLDRGVTWTQADVGVAGKARINSLGSIGDRIFAGTDAGIYVSSDQGASWKKTSVTVRTISFATSGSNLYAGTHRNGLVRSKDKGQTWEPIPALASKNIRSLLAANGRLYAGTDADGVAVYTDAGASPHPWS